MSSVLDALRRARPHAEIPSTETIPVAAPAPLDIADEPLSPEQQLQAIKRQLGDLNVVAAQVAADITRCDAEGKKVEQAQAAHADARAKLESLHAERYSGGTVKDGEIDRAEAALAAAAEALGRAERAMAGAAAARAKYEGQLVTIRAQASALRAQAMPLFAGILEGIARDSMRDHKLAVEAFARGAQAEHHATIAAVTQVLGELGLTQSSYTHPNQGARLLQVPCTPTPDRYMDVFVAAELGDDIDRAARVIASELRSKLLP